MNQIKSLTYCGHSALLIKTNNAVIGIDPWLDGNPLCPNQFKNPERLDLIVLTHGHSDHAGDTTRLAKKYSSKIAATWELAMLFAEEGVHSDKLIPMNKGGTIEIEGLRFSLTNAFHSSSFDSPKRGTIYAGEPCGAVLSDGTNCIYHAGDTSLFSDMSLIKEQYQPTIALLPIGDRFTMGPFEAAQAAKLIGAKKNIPIHFGTFPLLTGTPGEFESACRDMSVESLTLKPGEEVMV
jgi:L-ascorbate metabolism protein UlaG (beta-lactamase superfamily)